MKLNFQDKAGSEIDKKLALPPLMDYITLVSDVCLGYAVCAELRYWVYLR
jgi:hypothetical protein